MGHHDHGHTVGARDGNRRALAVVLALTASFTVVEIIGGLFTGSLALLADAGHMLSDNLSLAVALFAAWLAGRPATPEKSFGYRRAEILAALANGVTLVAISIWVFVEAYERFLEPAEVLGGPMLAVAALGLLVGAVGAMIAAAIIILTGWRYADPLISVAIGLLILGSSWTLLRDSTNILLEATPRGLNAGEVGQKMAAAEGIIEVHDLHI